MDDYWGFPYCQTHFLRYGYLSATGFHCYAWPLWTNANPLSAILWLMCMKIDHSVLQHATRLCTSTTKHPHQNIRTKTHLWFISMKTSAPKHGTQHEHTALKGPGTPENSVLGTYFLALEPGSGKSMIRAALCHRMVGLSPLGCASTVSNCLITMVLSVLSQWYPAAHPRIVSDCLVVGSGWDTSYGESPCLPCLSCDQWVVPIYLQPLVTVVGNGVTEGKKSWPRTIARDYLTTPVLFVIPRAPPLLSTHQPVT